MGCVVKVNSAAPEVLKVSGEMKLINVGDEVIEGRWATNDLVFLIVNLHYTQILHGLMAY
jgi:hypothetical protein